MTSSELIALKGKYLAFKDDLEKIIAENLKASNKIEGTDTLLAEYYSIDDNSADGGYVKQAINKVNETNRSFRSVLASVNNRITNLQQAIERARDEELAEKIASSTSP